MKNVRTRKRLFCSMAIAAVMCITAIGSVSVKAESSDDSNGSEETIAITIDNSVSHLGVRFYPDTNDMDNFEYVEVGEKETYQVAKDAVARIRLYIQGDGYCLPEGYVVEGAAPLTNDDRVNMGWCRAAYTVSADADKTITIPEASVCTHPYADPSVRWGYYDRGDGTHAQACTLCGVDIPETAANHVLEEMTPTEYVDWYYNDGNFAGMSEETLALRKAEFISNITGELGIDANTKMKACKVCEHFEKIDSASADQPSETPGETTNETSGNTSGVTTSETTTTSETPAATSSSASLRDTNGILSEGSTIENVSITSGAVYERAEAAVKENIRGLGQFAVMEINLKDASNVQIHELNGYVQVSMPIPANINAEAGKTIAVYRLEDNGTLTRCQTTVENGVITFSTNHFSTYIVVEEDIAASPKTGDNTHVVIWTLLCIAGLGLIMTGRRKRYE